MIEPRAGHAAVLLRDGKVLVVGGDSTYGEVYDPTTDTWKLTEEHGYLKHDGITATLLPNGKVLVTGGNTTNQALLFDPASNKWSLTGSLHEARQHDTATLLPTGLVLAVGGVSGVYRASAELYEPEPVKGKTASILGLLLN
jgi:N-acetylneuraminic acid mutarotase